MADWTGNNVGISYAVGVAPDGRASRGRRGAIALALFVAFLLSAFAFNSVQAERAAAAPKYSFDFGYGEGYGTWMGFFEFTDTRANIHIMRDDRIGWSLYSAPAKFRKTGVKANFGQWGRMNLKVKQSSEWRAGFKPKQCTGRAGKYRFVTLVGRVDFRLENSSFRLGRNGPMVIESTQSRNANLSCPWDEMLDPVVPSPERGMVAVQAKAGNLTAIAVREPYMHSRSTYMLGLRERVGKVEIFRVAMEDIPASQYSYQSDFTAANLQLGHPGTKGAAAFTRTGPQAGTWLGNLRAWTPGAGWLSFAGSAFTADFGNFADVVDPDPFDVERLYGASLLPAAIAERTVVK